MKLINNPDKEQWPKLTARPQMQRQELEAQVRTIMERVKKAGDKALRQYTREFDGVDLASFKVGAEEFSAAAKNLPPDLKAALDLAYRNIEKFHAVQNQEPEIIETQPGVRCWRRQVGIEKVGLYVPGGSAPLFSSLLMLGIPARLAGCSEIRICTPPAADGNIHPAILYLAQKLGITEIFKAGGAQAIAAFTYGTESIAPVDKIFGPGNQYVTKAKELVQQDGIAIDMPAGPSEVLVIADSSAIPAYVAADLLSQAEHGADSQVMLLSDNTEILEACMLELTRQLQKLPRKDIAKEALENSKAVLLEDMNTCMQFSNAYAPEHLIIATENARDLGKQVVNAGSVFLGHYSCESAGDYASGTNHTLPTNGNARNYSGVSLDSFCKMITYQEITAQGLQKIGPAIEKLAAAEGLEAHKNAVTIRLKDFDNV